MSSKAQVHTDLNIQPDVLSYACAQMQIFTFMDTLQPSHVTDERYQTAVHTSNDITPTATHYK